MYFSSFYIMSKSGFLNYFSLGNNTNKVSDENKDTATGAISDFIPELKVDSPDNELIELSKKWIKEYRAYEESKVKSKQQENEKYWLGTQDEDNALLDEVIGMTHRPQDNIIFESLETFLPQATSKNPEPVVLGNASEEGKILADNVRRVLIDIADKQCLKLKIKSATRHWSLYYLGAIKVGWDLTEDDITYTTIRPQKLILDPNGHVDESANFTGEYIGIYKSEKAKSLMDKFPSKSNEIKAQVKGNLGTQIQYIEWWADGGEMVFWTLGTTVLDKIKNPNWNYDETETEINNLGEEIESIAPGRNHYKTPQFPLSFLSVFTLGKQPHDETGLIEQNLPNQDIINKTYRQIDKNVEDMNGGWVISGPGSGLSKEQSSLAIESLRTGYGVWIPSENTNSIQKISGTPLPSDVFNHLQDSRNQLRSIFGVQGSTPGGSGQEDTVRGKIIVAQQDMSRIGGGVGEYIEQFADRLFNLTVQMMYVYYDEEHIISVIGLNNTEELVSISKSDLLIDLRVSVKEGSLIPKDPLTLANQAIDLFGAGAIDLVELHRRLDSPNPEKIAADTIQFQMNPQSLLGADQQPQIPTEQGASDIGAGNPEDIQSSQLLGSVPI